MDDMIKSTPRGILVTRLWYLRQVDPRTILYTGLTRDGTFLIENGKISKAIKNFRFNESPLFLLNNLEAIGPAVRLAGRKRAVRRDAGDQGEGFQLHEPVGRGVGGSGSRESPPSRLSPPASLKPNSDVRGAMPLPH